MDTTPVAPAANPIREALASWLDAFNARDVEALMALYDPDAVYANDDAPLMRGVAEIRPWFEGAFASMKARAHFKEEALFQGADLSLIVGKFFTEFLEPDADSQGETGRSPGETGRVVVVFRRSQKGEWRLVLDMDNRPPDAQPSDFA